MSTYKRLLDRINEINEYLKPLEEAREKIRLPDTISIKKIEELRRLESFIWSKTESGSDYFKDKLIKHGDPCDYAVVDLIRNKINACADRKKASDFIIEYMSIALMNEKSGLITEEIISLLNKTPIQFIYTIVQGNKTSQESSIIITYLCLYIDFLHGLHLIGNESDRKIIPKLKTHDIYEDFFNEAIKIINREISGGERRKATIAKIIKREIGPKYSRMPCHNTLLNWINMVIKSRAE
ncbi:TPA: hypothetical protein PJF87_003842 [Escherichia coli]|nr:hypothetical protein [Escherichia coli]